MHRSPSGHKVRHFAKSGLSFSSVRYHAWHQGCPCRFGVVGRGALSLPLRGGLLSACAGAASPVIAVACVRSINSKVHCPTNRYRDGPVLDPKMEVKPHGETHTIFITKLPHYDCRGNKEITMKTASALAAAAITKAAFALATALVLAGCGGGGGGAAHPSSGGGAKPAHAGSTDDPSSGGAATPTDAGSNDDRYINALAATSLTGDRDDLIDEGHRICAKLNAGKVTGSSLTSSVVSDTGFDLRGALQMITAANIVYCPEANVPD